MIFLLFVGFVVGLCLWAGVCCSVYWVLRQLQQHFPFTTGCFGGLSLLGWMAVFAGAVWGGDGGSYRDNLWPSPSYPWGFMIAVGFVLLSTLAASGALVRGASQNRASWWQSLSLGSLYMALAPMASAAVLLPTGVGDVIANFWVQVEISPVWQALSGNWVFDLLPLFLLWLFPLGAPCAEIGIRSFKRAFVAHYDESLE